MSEMFIDFFNSFLYKSISFDFLLNSFDYKIDLLVIFTWWIVLSVDRLFESRLFMMRSIGSMRRTEVLFLFISLYFDLTMSLEGDLIFFVWFVSFSRVEKMSVFGQRALVRRGSLIMTEIKILLEMSSFFEIHIARANYLRFTHNCLLELFK